MKIHNIHRDSILIPPNRQRKEFDAEEIASLAGSIAQIGLIQPVVVRPGSENTYLLIAGERRLRALEYAWNFGDPVRCGDWLFEENSVPCILISDLSEVDAFEMELEENIRRIDLTWQEKAAATNQLYELRKRQADAAGTPEPSVGDIAKEIHATSEPVTGHTYQAVREDIILARNLGDSDVQKASSAKEAIKLLKRKEERKRHEELGISVGASFTAAEHSLIKGDCLSAMESLPSESFDVILTDPPYGMDAQEFGDSGGKTGGAHFYDDSYETWQGLMAHFAGASYRLAKPSAHLYVFCDIDRFVELKSYFAAEGWKVFRTPILWINPSSFRAPWPESGPQRKYQLCLYATKGDRRVTKLCPDYILSSTDPNLGHPAQKPVGVYLDLLLRSVRPGDTVLDPFCGSGTIFPAAHKALCRATGIELDDAAFGLASKRLGELT